LSYRRHADKNYGRKPSVEAPPKAERKVQAGLEKGWKDFFVTRGEYRKGEATRGELETALEVVKKKQRKAHVGMIVPDDELIPDAPAGEPPADEEPSEER